MSSRPWLILYELNGQWFKIAPLAQCAVARHVRHLMRRRPATGTVTTIRLLPAPLDAQKKITTTPA